MADAPTKQKRSKAKTAGIVIGIVFAVLIAGGGIFIWLSANNIINPSSIIQPAIITFSGEVSTAGFNTRPTAITFADQNSGEQRSENVNNGRYQILLPNGSHNWKVTVSWTGIAGSAGTCNAGSLSYNDITTPFQSRDFRC